MYTRRRRCSSVPDTIRQVRRLCIVGCFFVVLFSTPIVEAADECVKVSFRGDASTYNPYLPGWRTGGGTLATGGPYNPNSYDAALQLNLAKQYGCGYGSRAICHAVVQAPNGHAMVVRINDNGPLVPGRVIDLNEKSMQYLSGGTMGRNSGIVKNVTVTLLCGIEGMALGPLDPNEREAWASRTFDAPYANTGRYAASPFGNVTPFSNTPASSGYSSGGTANPSSGATYQNSAYQQPSYQQPISQALLQNQFQLQPDEVSAPSVTPPSAASLMVQPRQVSRGEQAVASWTSVGVSKSKPCRVTVVSGGKEILVGQGNEGSRQLKIGSNSSLGTLTFTMRCVSSSGTSIERTAALMVK